MVSPNFSTHISLSLVGGKSLGSPSKTEAMSLRPSIPGHHIMLTSSSYHAFRDAPLMFPPPVTINRSTLNSLCKVFMALDKSIPSFPAAIQEICC